MKDRIKLQVGDTLRIKGYCDRLNGKIGILLSVDGDYHLVKIGRDIAEIYGCEFEFVKRTKRGRDLAVKWNIRNAQGLIDKHRKNLTSAQRELKKYQKMVV